MNDIVRPSYDPQTSLSVIYSKNQARTRCVASSNPRVVTSKVGLQITVSTRSTQLHQIKFSKQLLWKIICSTRNKTQRMQPLQSLCFVPCNAIYYCITVMTMAKKGKVSICIRPADIIYFCYNKIYFGKNNFFCIYKRLGVDKPCLGFMLLISFNRFLTWNFIVYGYVWTDKKCR